jgi:hypothetical protein
MAIRNGYRIFMRVPHLRLHRFLQAAVLSSNCLKPWLTACLRLPVPLLTKALALRQSKKFCWLTMPATFAEQILALLRSSELRARLSQQAKLFVQRHFNLQESVAELVQDYQALLAQHT